MTRIRCYLAASETRYIVVPVRGIITGAKAVWQTTVTTSNIITISRGTTTVCLVTAVTTAGQVMETGVPDATNKDLVFDPATAAYSFIKIVQSGGNAVAADLIIEFDEYASVTQAAKEA